MNGRHILLVAATSIATAAAMLSLPALGQHAQNSPAVAPAPAPEPQQVVPTSQIGLQQSFAPIVRRTAPAVVNVYSSVTIRRSNCPYTDPFWASFYCGSNTQTRDEKVDNSLGSGVIVAADGVIVTNNHVVADGQEFRVALSDRREFPAKLVMADSRTDLAVLKIDTKGERLPTLDYADTRGVQVGDLVLAIGNPFAVGQSVSSGIVSALARTDVNKSDFSSFVQTDASINPGNSGGALVDMNGRLVGVNTLIFSRGGGSNGIGFAIPSEMVRRVVNAAVNGGTLVRPWLGAKGDAVTSAIAASLKMDRPRGVVITEIYPGSPSEKAGLKKGDVVTAVDGREVYDERGMKFVAATKEEGEIAHLTVLRAGQERQIQVKLSAPPGATTAELKQVGGRNPFTGAQVAELSPALAEELGLDPFKYKDGMLVRSVPRYSIAGSVGFQANDIIREVNGVTTNTAEELERAINQVQKTPNAQWNLAIERDGRRIETTLN